MDLKSKHILLIMYDIPCNSKEEASDYREFRKNLLKEGAYQIQESIYAIDVLDGKTESNKIENRLSLKAPLNSNIRSILLTQSHFDQMKVISGEITLGEKILKNSCRIIEF